MNPESVQNAIGAGVGMGVALGKYAINHYSAQTELLSELRRRDEWLLIILDACRYDVFDDCAPRFFESTYRPVWSSGRNTFEYVRTAWPDYYPDVRYLSAAPVVNANTRTEESAAALKMFRGYTASEHIYHIDELFAHESTDRIGTCPPEIVTKAALDTRADKMVAHYFQPHAPYIGSERIVKLDKRGISNTKLIWDAVRSGDLSIERVRRAYEANLERALHSVTRLIDETDYETVVVTADHGEALGEYRVLSHPDKVPYHPKTRIVPWAKVEAVREYDEWDVDAESGRRTDKTVTERLSQLGYI